MSLVQKQKHYKIIFIKAPSAPAYQAPVIPAQALNEEKTLVYVLVKKPDEQEDVVIPTAAPTKPSKPEVYFIKYRTQKEQAQNAGGQYEQQAQIQQNVGGQSQLDSSNSDDSGAGLGLDIRAENAGISSVAANNKPATNYGPPSGQSGPY